MSFSTLNVFPGVTHIRDGLGVCATLLTGADRALLVDSGYGAEDLAAFVRALTDRPVTLLLTHAHHDHALGARWFDSALMGAPDLPLLAIYTGESLRRAILAQALDAGLLPEPGFLTDPLPPVLPLEAAPLDLGGLTAVPVPCPGHTPGSAAVYVPERRLLLTGDAWNPVTWVFFPEALPVREALGNLRRLLDLPFEHVLCPHRFRLYPRAALERFLELCTEDALRRAVPVDIPPYGHIDTRRVLMPRGQELVFDWAKSGLADIREEDR